jgi:hypothetical protein
MKTELQQTVTLVTLNGLLTFQVAICFHFCACLRNTVLPNKMTQEFRTLSRRQLQLYSQTGYEW